MMINGHDSYGMWLVCYYLYNISFAESVAGLTLCVILLGFCLLLFSFLAVSKEAKVVPEFQEVLKSLV
jgi:hypothetical protein